MWITTDEAVEMYARFLKARYGVRAKKVASEKAIQLHASGDAEGERVWNEVARHVDGRDSAPSESTMALA